MERAGVRQVGDSMIVPVSFWQQVMQVVDTMPEILTRLDVLESVSVTNSEWLSRQQAMQFLHVGSTKLWELTTSGMIETNRKTGKPLYKTDSCRQYLASQGFSQQQVQARFREILQRKQKK